MENVPVDQWAQALWRYAHVTASALPTGALTDALKQSSVAFVYAQCHLIPCDTCRDHFNVFVKAQPPVFVTGEDVQRWWLQCHNYTNRLLGKAEWSIDQLRKVYPPNGMYPQNDGPNTVTSLPTLPQYQMVQYRRPERMMGVNVGHIPIPRTALPGTVPKGASWTKPKQAPSLQRFQQSRIQQPKNGLQIKMAPKASSLMAAKLTNYARQVPVNRSQISYQTQQWRALTKVKTGVAKKKKCSSCSKRKAP